MTKLKGENMPTMTGYNNQIQGGNPSTWAPQAQTQPMGQPLPMPVGNTGYDTSNPFAGGGAPQPGGGYMPQDPYQDYQMQAPQPFPFPGQWGAASDIYSGIGQGSPFGTNQWNIGANQLAQMAQGGMPTDVSALEATYAPMMQRQMEELTKQGAETAGMAGTRYSSPFARNISEFGSKIAENFANTMAQQNIAAQEAARGRQMGAFGQLGQRGGMDLQAQQAARGLQLGAAGGLGSLGSQYLYAPMNIAQGMMGMGGGMQNQQQQEINAMMNDPYAAMAMQMAGSMPNQYMPETYQKGWASDMLNAGSMLPFMFGQGGGGGPNPEYAPILGGNQPPPGPMWT